MEEATRVEPDVVLMSGQQTLLVVDLVLSRSGF